MRTAEQQLNLALAQYRRLVGAPLSPVDYYNQASASNLQGRFAEALTDFDQALALGLDRPELHHNRGIALFNLHQPEAALTSFERALALAQGADAGLMRNTQGFVLQSLGRLEEARSSYQHALALNPDLALARLNLGIICLTLGDWQAGWEGYEWRWAGAHEAGQGTFQRPRCELPQWQGEAVPATDALLVFAEQGLGDVLQFCRYLTLARARFSRVSLVCPAPLVRLLRSALGDTVEILDTLPVDQPAWQWHCPLMSLPKAFQTRINSVPGQTPYLTPDPALVPKWHARLAGVAGQRLRVGLCWAGAKGLKEDAKRSLPLSRLAPLLQVPGIAWVSLQKGEAACQLAQLPQAVKLFDWTDELQDFADTAALMSKLDLVISVDTAIVHLAGALGQPVWLLNRFEREWRWLKDRDDSPWYPSVRLFNQTSAGDWDEVVSRVVAALPALSGPMSNAST